MNKVIFAVFLLIIAGLIAVPTESALSKESKADDRYRRGETRQTLDPAMFSQPKVAAAYRVAKEIPWVLDSIYCYCMCEESPAFRHKSLLSCYVDNHAAL